MIFQEVMAFRWDFNKDHKGRHDTTYEVVDSSWLEAHLEENFGAEHSLRWKWDETTKSWSKVYDGSVGSRFAHYRIGFNAYDLYLDVAARRIETPPTHHANNY